MTLAKNELTCKGIDEVKDTVDVLNDLTWIALYVADNRIEK